MGLRDRDYTQSDYSDDFDHFNRHRQRRSRGRSIVLTIIFINFALWLGNGLLFDNNALTDALLLQQRLAEPIVQGGVNESISFWNPAETYRYLTYGFVHHPSNWTHIVFNMIALLMFGYGMMLGIGPGGLGFVRGENVEDRLGKLEFTAFYLATIIIGGLVFAMMNHDAKNAGVLGASGGVCGVVILYAWLYPRKTLLLYGIIPLPMWAIGGLIVVTDAMGAAGSLWDGIAYSVHLTGAAFGTLYYFLFLKKGIRLTGWMESHGKRQTADAKKQKTANPDKNRFQVHVHVPEDDLASFPDEPATEEEFSRRLDAILKRYGEVGESGLSAAEREFLREASRKFAEKKR